MFSAFLYLHIAAGTVGLVLGPISMFAAKRRGLHTSFGLIYFYMMALVCASAAALAILNWAKSWWFLFVAAFSFAFAWRGYRAAKARGQGWLRSHISGMLGSYIAMTTALIVVNASSMPGYGSVPDIVYWLLPTIVGAPFITMTAKRYVR
jgi:hypothetical protein